MSKDKRKQNDSEDNFSPFEITEDGEFSADNEQRSGQESNVPEEESNQEMYIETDYSEVAPDYEQVAEQIGADSGLILGIDSENDIFYQKKRKRKKVLIISGSIFAALIIICGSAFAVLSKYWKSGEMAMPRFIANTGIFQGEDFRFFDGITVNGTNVSGMTVKEAKTILEEKEQKNPRKYEITVSYDDKTVTFTNENFKFKLDSEKVLLSAKSYCIDIMKGKISKKPKDFVLGISPDIKSKRALVEETSKVIYKDAVNASFGPNNGGGFTLTEEQVGYKLDQDDLFDQLEKFFSSGELKAEISAKVVAIEPTVYKKDLEGNITLLAEFKTTSTNNANGNSNMAKAMSLCNGSVIQPGETWSFNKHTGNSSLQANGWKPAGAYSNGYVVEEVGGGICQASSTIYNAGLYAGLTVVERYNHTWASSYVKEGLDASINYPSADLKLKNGMDYPVYMDCSMSGKVLTCKMYGRRPANYDTIKLSTRRTETVEGQYFRVAAARAYYKDGVQLNVEELPSSKYSLKPKQSPGQATTPTTPSSQQTGGGTSSNPPVSSQPESETQQSSQQDESSSENAGSSEQD